MIFTFESIKITDLTVQASCSFQNFESVINTRLDNVRNMLIASVIVDIDLLQWLRENINKYESSICCQVYAGVIFQYYKQRYIQLRSIDFRY